MAAYLYIYNNWRVYELPWDSAVTWVVAAILCDLGYYWVHRAAHGKLVVYFQCFNYFFVFASSNWNFSLAHIRFNHFFKNYCYFFTILTTTKPCHSLAVMKVFVRNLQLF